MKGMLSARGVDKVACEHGLKVSAAQDEVSLLADEIVIPVLQRHHHISVAVSRLCSTLHD